MFDFDFEEKSAEQKEKELYEEASKKQASIARKVICGVFCGLGGTYLLIGIAALIISEDLETNIFGFVFGGIGLLFLLLGILLFFVLPKKGNYERYKKNINRFGYMNSYNASTKLEMLEHENKELKERIEYLEKKMKELEDK